VADGFACPSCQFQTVTTEQMPEYARAVADAYRRQVGRLTSDDIRAARAALGLSQQEFAKFLGVGVASVKRWEWGHAQSPDEDQNIRQRVNPEAVEQFAADSLWNALEARRELTELRSLEAVLVEAWALDPTHGEDMSEKMRSLAEEMEAQYRPASRKKEVDTQMELVA